MIKNIFLDLDDTILDFHASEREAIVETLEHFGVLVNEEIITIYRNFNKKCWQALERGEMTREEVLTKRFELLFSDLDINVSSEDVQYYYERRLAEGVVFVDGAIELLESLKGKYNLYITSNGTAFVQDRRIAASGLAEYFDDIFISERMGANKPDKRFFDACFERMENKDRDSTVIIGDTLTSDILGGINAGIHTCYFTFGKEPEPSDIPAEYIVRKLEEIPEILEKI